ncbi:MAG: hypothetical protein JST42_17975 [Bacteroidetes bacterium]|nr:hypothetical protein [Bacteroidota bacterium]
MKAERIRIIVIDDDPFTLAMTGETIKRIVGGGQPVCFASATDALDYLVVEDHWRVAGVADSAASQEDGYFPGMILSDLHMPGMDGFQFLDEFAKLDRAIRDRYSVFILSSTTNEEDWIELGKKTCFARGCSKPLTIPILLELIGTACREFEERNPGRTS